LLPPYPPFGLHDVKFNRLKIKLVSLSFPLQCLLIGKYHLENLHKLLGIYENLSRTLLLRPVSAGSFSSYNLYRKSWTSFGSGRLPSKRTSSVYLTERALKKGVLWAINIGGAVYT